MMVSKPAKLLYTVIIIIAIVVNTAVTSLLWFWFYPKRPFEFLTMDMVERIDCRYRYVQLYDHVIYRTFSLDEQKQIVESMRKLTFARAWSKKDYRKNSPAGAGYDPIWIWLKNGVVFGYATYPHVHTIYYGFPCEDIEVVSDVEYNVKVNGGIYYEVLARFKPLWLLNNERDRSAHETIERLQPIISG